MHHFLLTPCVESIEWLCGVHFLIFLEKRLPAPLVLKCTQGGPMMCALHLVDFLTVAEGDQTGGS